MAWPQWIYVALIAFGLFTNLVAALQKPHPSVHIFVSLAGTAGVAYLLHVGGFWTAGVVN